MEMSVYTIHHRAGEELRAVPDRLDRLALALPPIWALWHRLWIITGLMIALLVAAALWSPFAIGPVYAGIAAIAGFEGGTLRRLELRLSGWMETGAVVAASEEGAEELFLTGRIQ